MFEHNIFKGKSIWIDCPVCGSDSHNAVWDGEEDDGGYIVTCTNLACGSNGGDNFDAVKVSPEFLNLARWVCSIAGFKGSPGVQLYGTNMHRFCAYILANGKVPPDQDDFNVKLPGEDLDPTFNVGDEVYDEDGDYALIKEVSGHGDFLLLQWPSKATAWTPAALCAKKTDAPQLSQLIGKRPMRVRDRVEGAGAHCVAYGFVTDPGGIEWAVVLFDGHEDPTTFKLHCLEDR